MKRDLTTVEQPPRLNSAILIGGLAFNILLLIVLPRSAQAQIFDDVIRNAATPGGAACQNAVGNLAARICNVPETPSTSGASGGSTTSLSRERAPSEEERKVQRKIGPINLYISGGYERFDKDVTKFEPGYKTNTGRFLLGTDYSFGDQFAIGGAFKYAHDRGKFDSQPPEVDFDEDFEEVLVPIPRGRFSTNSYGGLLHASYVPTLNSFIDTSFGYTRKNYFVRRGVVVVKGDRDATGTADGNTDGNEFTLGMNGGYNFGFQNFTIGPRLGLNYTRTEIDGFREKGRLISAAISLPEPDDPGIPPPTSPGTGLELIYNRQSENSLTSVLGLYGSVAISTGFGVLIPQTTLEYVHEFLDPQRKITFRFVEDLNRTKFRFQNDPPDRNYFNLGVGVVLQLARGIAPFLNYRALVGYKDQRSHIATAGVRVEF
jgi:uncharacterized protein YhjY with autotransporter beta-barrel domain